MDRVSGSLDMLHETSWPALLHTEQLSPSKTLPLWREVTLS